MEVLAGACKQKKNCTFTFPESGAVTRFVITTSVNKVLSANIIFKAANGLGNMTG